MDVHDLTRTNPPGALHDNAARFKWEAGRIGMGLLGVGNEFARVTIPHSTALTFSNGDRISLSVWAKRDTSSFHVPLGSKDGTTTGGRLNWSLGLNNSNGLQFDYYSAAGDLQRWTSDSSLTGTELRHVAFDYIYGTAASATGYTDGAQTGSSGFINGTGNETPDTGGTNPAYLGFDFLTGGGTNGWLFQIAVWKNRAGGLTAGDVLELYRRPYAMVRPAPRSRVGLTRSVTLSGTAIGGIAEADVVAGGKVITITLSGDTWATN
jgi:hypothetical protein